MIYPAVSVSSISYIFSYGKISYTSVKIYDTSHNFTFLSSEHDKIILLSSMNSTEFTAAE